MRTSKSGSNDEMRPSVDQHSTVQADFTYSAYTELRETQTLSDMVKDRSLSMMEGQVP